MSTPASAVVRPHDAGGHVEAYCSTGSSPGRHAEPAHRFQVQLTLDHRGRTDAVVHYEAYGPESAPVVVVLGGISAHRHLRPTGPDPSEGWWPGAVGPGSALDIDRFRLVGMDYLGGPSTPLSGRAPLTTSDQAKAVLAVLDHLGIEKATLVGASYGGMVALALAIEAPARVDRLALLCAAHRTHPMATAFRALQRKVTRFSIECGRPEDGMAMARALAMATYRSAEEFEGRFGRAWISNAEGRPRFPVEDYLDACGRAFVERFPAGAFLHLSESIDLHDVDPSTLNVPTTLVSWNSDALVPPWLVEELRQSVRCPCRHVELSSPFGHDAFLKEVRDVSSVLRGIFGEEEAR